MDPENNPELTRANGPANAGANRGQSLNMQDPEGQRAQQANNVQGTDDEELLAPGPRVASSSLRRMAWEQIFGYGFDFNAGPICGPFKILLPGDLPIDEYVLQHLVLINAGMNEWGLIITSSRENHVDRPGHIKIIFGPRFQFPPLDTMPLVRLWGDLVQWVGALGGENDMPLGAFLRVKEIAITQAIVLSMNALNQE